MVSNRLYDEVGDVVRALGQLADELRELGLVEPAFRCDTLSRRLSKAMHDSMADTQPLDVRALRQPKSTD